MILKKKKKKNNKHVEKIDNIIHKVDNTISKIKNEIKSLFKEIKKAGNRMVLLNKYESWNLLVATRSMLFIRQFLKTKEPEAYCPLLNHIGIKIENAIRPLVLIARIRRRMCFNYKDDEIPRIIKVPHMFFSLEG